MKKLVAAMLATGVLLAGCGGEDAKPKTVEVKNEAGKKVTGIERRDSSGRTYDDITVNFQDRFMYGDEKHLAYRDLYWATAEKDYDKLATDFIPEYTKETDAFKRQDMIKALTPQLDEIYKKYHGAKNVTITMGEATSFYGYDAESKAFKISAPQGNNSIAVRKASDMDRFRYNVYMLPLGMTESYKPYYLKVSEDEARRIESYLSSKRQNANDPVDVLVQVQGYVVDAQSTMSEERFAIVAADAITFLDKRTGEKIVTVQSKDLPKIIDTSTTSLNLPADINTEFRKKFGLGEVRSTLGVTG